MTLWKKLLGIEDLPEDDPPAAPPSEPTESEEVETGVSESETVLVSFVTADSLSEGGVLSAFRSLQAEGEGARAVELLARIVSRHPDEDTLRIRLADALVTRGDLVTAEVQLAALLARARPPTEALMLMGEIEERRGDQTAAASAYERILAHDVDFPQARERVDRLREARESRHELAGATLLTDGALARGRYRVLRELGRGGAGTVFAAEDGDLGRVVALKVYHRRGRVERERLLVEARAPARLEHPGVVRVFDLDQRLGALVMEWVRGGSVRAELRKGRFDLTRAVRWIATALEALEFVHRQGFVHRDIKPSNFLLRDDDRVVVTDFGLAARAGEPVPRSGGEGTLSYMSPEQREGGSAAPGQDVYSLGASMREIFELVAGPVPAQLFELAAACTRRDPTARPTISELKRDIHL